MRNKVDEKAGNKYGRWTVVTPWEPAIKNGVSCAMTLCVCECGTFKIVHRYTLRNGTSVSCGCAAGFKKGECDGNATHKMSGTKTHVIWKGMRQRCNNPRNLAYRNYGAKGITVCKEWDSFEQFYADMGECPDGLSLDRIDSTKNYCKENCRWADDFTQAQNTTKRKDNTLGRTGIKYGKSGWAAVMQFNRETHFRGYFDTKEEAILARELLEMELQGCVRPAAYEGITN
jgi:hypothetical protein